MYGMGKREANDPIVVDLYSEDPIVLDLYSE